MNHTLKYQILNSPEFILYKYLVIGLFIFFLFKGLKLLVPLLIKNKKLKKFLEKYLPLLEIKVWGFFLILSSYEFIQNNEFLFGFGFFLVVLIGTIWWSLFSLKDYMARLIFRATTSFEISNSLKLNEISGKILQFHFRTLELETDQGQSIYIPYSQLIKGQIIRVDDAVSVINHSFRLCVPGNKGYQELENEIKSTLLGLPWSSIKKVPTVQFISEEKNTRTIDVTAFVIDKKYTAYIENELRKKFGVKPG